ncbi:hypothetical protein SLEP1_g11511 [Rubroshorea leprosula]|uniref:Protein kinase domain-containing protein n=1 Tax=Rubroshorea leprosula TaxID=152421 RepID=A0AAV5IMY9_9ROSI|nr:hypothetical protein SLEP1_g11511 [Rubroshorea leprosula]
MAQMWFTGKMSTDIKCANILVDAYGSVKLADFGLAKVTKLNDVKSCKGTAFWMAPEVVNLKNQGYGPPADIWSLGCTVLEMLTRKIPYSPLEWMQALFRIGKGEPPTVPDSFQQSEIGSRDFKTQQIRDHPYFPNLNSRSPEFVPSLTSHHHRTQVLVELNSTRTLRKKQRPLKYRLLPLPNTYLPSPECRT